MHLKLYFVDKNIYFSVFVFYFFIFTVNYTKIFMKPKLPLQKISFCLLLLSYFYTLNSQSQIVGDYRSIASGNWTSISSWQYYNGTSWVTPTGTNPQGYPSQFSGTKSVIIQAGHTITFLDTYVTTTFSNLLINGTLALSGSGSAPIFNIKTTSIVVVPNLTPAATINFTSKGNLLLPVNATIQTGLLGLSGSCTANQKITIGTTTLATCAGAGQVVLLFSQFMSSGGTLNAQPTANAPVCATNTINLNGTIIGTPGTGLTYTWTITNPLGVVSTVNNQNTNITNTIQGTYTAKLKVSTTYSGTAFSNEETIQVIVNPNPIVSISPDSVICSNAVKSIIASGATSYLWTSSVAGTLFTDLLATNPYNGTNLSTVFVKSAESVSVTATGSSNGCSTANSTQLTINTPASWNGVSWNTAPTSDRDLIFNGNFNSQEDVLGCSCTVNSGAVKIATDHDMILQRNVNVAGGSLTFENNSNLIQKDNIQNSGTITIKRNSTALKRLDYTLWSAPVVGQNLFNFSPLTLTNRFYKFNSLTNIYVVIPTSTNFSKGNGYLIRTPNNHPATTPTIFNGIFTGVPTNGPVSTTIVDGGSALSRFNAIGNPYPSALKIDDFILSNLTNIEGTLWFWRKTNDDSNPVSYSSCTTAGCTINNGHNYIDENIISVGQGFLIQAKSGASVVNFSNTMRANTNDDQFFRFSSFNKDRFWLELKNDLEISYGQNLIAYLPNATLGYDNGIDGLRIDDSSTAIYTKIDAIEMTIQARPNFNDSDNIPLLFKTSVAGNYMITVSNLEGIFGMNQNIFVKDNQLNTIHNIKIAPYTFYTIAGVFENRFEIVYQNTSLNTTSSINRAEKITVSKSGNELIVQSELSNLKAIKIVDLWGREIYGSTNLASKLVKINIVKTNQLYVIQTITESDATFITKIIN